MVWREVVLRSAGFAVDLLRTFGSPSVVTAVDRSIALAEDAAGARTRVIDECTHELATAEGARRKIVVKALRKLRAGTDPGPDITGSAVEALRHGDAAVVASRAEIESALEIEQRRISGALRDLASEPRFREALAWQNRDTLDNALASLIRTPVEERGWRARQHEAMVASYAQRYCAKNDTIGFFGPIGWAKIVDADFVVRVQPGPRLLDRRRVRFEYWCIDTLAETLAASLRADVAPRKMPTIRLDGTTLYYPVDRSYTLPPEHAAVLSACDGETAAREIARKLGRSEADVFEVLGELVELKVIRWTIEIPTGDLDPDLHLRTALERLPASAAREAARAQLAELEAGRGAISDAAGDAAALDLAQRELEGTFSRITGVPATRRSGQTYAARSLVHEDTRRDVKIELGSRFIESIGPALALVMVGARWYTHRIAAAYRRLFRVLYEQHRGPHGVDFLRFLEAAAPYFEDQFESASTIRPVIEETHQRWLSILGIESHHTRVQTTSAALRARVLDAFDAPCPGWPEARYHSPDLMVAAASCEQFARGDFLAVIGEIHTGLHTFTSPLFMEFHDDPSSLVRARQRDLEIPLIKPVEARTNALRTGRFAPVPDDIDLEVSDAKSWRARELVIPIAELVVADVGDRLVARTRDHKRELDLLATLEMWMQLSASTHYTILPRSRHAPRVTVDNVCISRESWRFTRDELPFANLEGAARFVAIRRWAHAEGVPRYVFVRVPREPKPVYVDLFSPLYVDSFVRLLRDAPHVDVSEMLPSLDETWLVDAAKTSYVSELRIAMTDPRHWHPEPY